MLCLYIQVMQAINMEPPWKSGKIASNQGWICWKLSNLPESVPILCVVELIELPFVPRTTEAQETGAQTTNNGSLSKESPWLGFYMPTCVISMYSRMIKNSALFQSRSCICLLSPSPAPYLWTEHSTTCEGMEKSCAFSQLFQSANSSSLRCVPSSFQSI